MFRIGPYSIDPPLALAPMAGVTDRPFRHLCRSFGAGLAVSEMVIAVPRLWESRKSRTRLDLTGEPEPAAVQIMGAEPGRMAEAARLAVERGAQIVDINMGCPARRVCNRAAGSALMEDEPLAGRIMAAVVAAVAVPVTVKIRLGPDRRRLNGAEIARIAGDCGIAAIAVHGRTRACRFDGPVDYGAIGAVKAAAAIPVIANGDIDSPAAALRVLEITGADGLMVGRAALGRPWLFRTIAAALAGEGDGRPPTGEEIAATVSGHIAAVHDLYGGVAGVRIARKHIGWYLDYLDGPPDLRSSLMREPTADGQLRLLAEALAAS